MTKASFFFLEEKLALARAPPAQLRTEKPSNKESGRGRRKGAYPRHEDEREAEGDGQRNDNQPHPVVLDGNGDAEDAKRRHQGARGGREVGQAEQGHPEGHRRRQEVAVLEDARAQHADHREIRVAGVVELREKTAWNS